MPSDRYVICHFSQGNPAGPGQDNVPALLRRVADTIEQLGAVEVQDIVMHTEVDRYGYSHSLTVYYDDDGERPPATPGTDNRGIATVRQIRGGDPT